MKTIKTVLCGLLSMVLMGGCSDLENDSLPQETKRLPSYSLTKAQKEVSNRQQEFCVNFFRDIALQNLNADVLVSPFSLSVDMAMLLPAAKNGTYEELARGLGFEGLKQEDIFSYYSTVLESLDGTSLSAANAIWYDSEYTIRDDFAKIVADVFSAPATKLSFMKSSSVNVVNDWASQKTKGKIKRLISGFDDNTVAVLTNALYFESGWSGDYSKEKRSFTNEKGNSSNRDFFTGGKEQEMLEYNTWKSDSSEPSLIRIPYKDGFGMLIVLPPATQTITEFLNTLTYDKLMSWCYSSESTLRKGITIHIPMFKNEFELPSNECISTLENMGIKSVFNNMTSDLSGMLETDKTVHIGRICQKSAIEVTEKGTTAATATAILVNGQTANLQPGPKEYEFVVDRPFIYAIIDRQSTFLYMGTVVK